MGRDECVRCVCVCAVEFRVGRFSAELVGARASDSHGATCFARNLVPDYVPAEEAAAGRRGKVSLEENRSQAPRSRAEKRSSCQKLFSLEEEGQKVFGAKSGSPLPRVWSHGVLFREENRFRVPCGKCQITDLRGGLCSEQRKSNKARKKIKEFVLVLRGEKKV